MMDDVYKLGAFQIPESWGEYRAMEIQWAAKEGYRPGETFILDLAGTPWCPLKWYFAAKPAVVFAVIDEPEAMTLFPALSTQPIRFGVRDAFLEGAFPDNGKMMDVVIGLGIWNTTVPMQMIRTLERCHAVLRKGGILLSTLEEDGRFELNSTAAADLLKMKGFDASIEEIGRTSLGVRVVGLKAAKK